MRKKNSACNEYKQIASDIFQLSKDTSLESLIFVFCDHIQSVVNCHVTLEKRVSHSRYTAADYVELLYQWRTVTLIMTAVFCACVQAKNFALHESTHMCLSLEWLSPLLLFFCIITARGVVNADTPECCVECVNIFPAVRQEEQLCVLFFFLLSPVSEEARSE